MSEDGSSEAGEIVRVAPRARVSRTGLIWLFAIAVTAGLSVYAVFPDSVGGPPLPVTVSIGKAPAEATGQISLVTDVVEVTNVSDGSIGRLSIELNGQYLLMQASPLGPGEKLVLPQEIFTDKRSSQRFRPDRHEVTEVVVAGQLPGNARGMSKFEFEELARE